jgi:hypothetical protein
MPVLCNTSDAPTLLRYTFEGEWSARDLIELRHELIRAGQLTPKSCVLFDLTRATTIPPLADLERVLRVATADAVFPACRAFLVMTPQQHDVARHLQALMGPDAVINETFQDEMDAMQWLSKFAGRSYSIR